jgi:hypothetical protein
MQIYSQQKTVGKFMAFSSSDSLRSFLLSPFEECSKFSRATAAKFMVS